MTHIARLTETLTSATETLGFNPLEVEQGSYQWFQMRLGVISASNASKLLAKRGSVTRDSYLAQLVGEIATGMPQDEINAKAMAWGKENEPKARVITSYSIHYTKLYDLITVGIAPTGSGKDIGIQYMKKALSINGLSVEGQINSAQLIGKTLIHNIV